MAINNAGNLWLKRVDPIMHKHTEKAGVRADITTNMLVLELGITSYLHLLWPLPTASTRIISTIHAARAPRCACKSNMATDA